MHTRLGHRREGHNSLPRRRNSDPLNAEGLVLAVSHSVNNIDAENKFCWPGRDSGCTVVRRVISRLFEIGGQFPGWHPSTSQSTHHRDPAPRLQAGRSSAQGCPPASRLNPVIQRDVAGHRKRRCRLGWQGRDRGDFNFANNVRRRSTKQESPAQGLPQLSR